MNTTNTTKKTAIILINVGTPDSAEVKDVRRYLFEFLNDPKVIDLPWLARKILVNAIIVPFRAPKSAKLYQQLWTKDGSPLLKYSYSLRNKLAKKTDADVYVAMRYQNPSMKKVFEEVASKNYQKVTVVPMYPHYAESTTGTTIEYAQKLAAKRSNFPPVNFVPQFYKHKGYINAFVEQTKGFDLKRYDHILFSYHGLPMRQIQKMHPKVATTTCTCETALPKHGNKCYKATCYETTRLLSAALHLPAGSFTTAFQSRLSNNWLEPFSDKTLIALAQQGKKKVLVFAPAFVADCLETFVEIEHEYKELFIENGGHTLDLVHSLNDSDVWADGLLQIIMDAESRRE